jgi:cell division protein FtsI/penicillin-binding protein 2
VRSVLSRLLSTAQLPHLGAVVSLVVGLGLLTPGPGRSSPSDVLEVDLRHLAFSETEVRARLTDGRSATLTIDRTLQRTAARLLARARPIRGAVVMASTRSGHVLVWAEWQREAGAKGAVLLEARSPAASIFKVVTTAALLDRAKVHPRQRVCTTGGDHRIGPEHLSPAHGNRATCGPFSAALGLSRNAVFAQLAARYLRPDELLDEGEALGFNGRVPFEAKVPVGHLNVPTDKLGMAKVATGFEGSTLSPLGGAYLAYVIANGGRAARFRIVESAGDYQAPKRRQSLGRVLSVWAAGQLRKMMEATVHSGTSLQAFTTETGEPYLPGLPVAGKTGTLRPAQGAPMTTWFIGFAPSRRPQVVISVLLDNGPVWRQKANELARDMLRAYFAERGVAGVTAPL